MAPDNSKYGTQMILTNEYAWLDNPELSIYLTDGIAFLYYQLKREAPKNGQNRIGQNNDDGCHNAEEATD